MGAAMIGVMVLLMAGGLFGLNLHGGGKGKDTKAVEAQKTEAHSSVHDGGSSSLGEKENARAQDEEKKETDRPVESK